MPDALFAHPRLAPVYDAFDGTRIDLAHYVAIADEFGARSVLDIGCGTGNLAVLLAATGRRVVGLDPAEASLEVAMARPGGELVTWLEGDASALPALAVRSAGPLGPAFDLAVMTGNVAQVFVGDEEWRAMLGAVRSVLRPGGHLVFETRRPEARAWEEWAAETAPVTLQIPGVGRVERRPVSTRVDLPLVSFRHAYRFESDGETVLSDSTLRFRGRDELEACLVANDFRVVDVRDAPDRPGREFVFVAERLLR